MSDQIKAEVIMGKDAEDFVHSELGRTILEMAKQDFQHAAEAFCEADLSDSAAVAKVQQDMRVARALDKYLYELITRGREAFEAFKQQHSQQ